MMTAASIAVVQMKIAIADIRPPIWRRVLVPNTMTLDELHVVIQESMGWEDYHLHEFRIDGTRYGTLEWDETYDGLDETKMRLSNLVQDPGYKFHYIYDFGDYWQHVLVMEQLLPFEPDSFYPVCLKAKRACPPEDVGGVWGYADFVSAIQDPKHPEHREMLTWYGEVYDPEFVDLEAINAQLRALFRGKRWSQRTVR